MLDDPPNMIDLINVLFIPFVQIIPSGHLNHLCSLCHGDIPPSLMVVLQFFHHQPLDTCQVSTQFLLCPSVSQRKMSTHSLIRFLFVETGAATCQPPTERISNLCRPDFQLNLSLRVFFIWQTTYSNVYSVVGAQQIISLGWSKIGRGVFFQCAFL